VLGFEVGKKIFFSQHFDMDVKNAKFNADLKSIEKSVKKFLQKSY
jgi:hypothetical protein